MLTEPIDGNDAATKPGGTINTPPSTEIEAAVKRILNSAAFSTSSRCSRFLEFVVFETLQGRKAELKERTLGIALFNRTPTYSVSEDSIVRVKANEVRKRLAQYYADNPSDAIRLAIPSGGYVPTFSFAPHLSSKKEEASAPSLENEQSTGLGEIQTPVLHQAPTEAKNRNWSWVLLFVGVIVLAGLFLSFWKRSSTTPFQEFWNPILKADNSPILYVGSSGNVWIIDDRLSAVAREALSHESPVAALPINHNEMVSDKQNYFSLGNVKAVVELSNFLLTQNVHAETKMGTPLALDDLNNHTVISIGAFSNPWTLDSLAHAHFQLKREPMPNEPGHLRLVVLETQPPGRRWQNVESPFQTPTEDFALISRTSNATSKSAFVSVAGLTHYGTEAAAEFLLQPSYWTDFSRHLPAGWQSKNLQIVLRTTIVENRPTPPQVVAFYSY